MQIACACAGDRQDRQGALYITQSSQRRMKPATMNAQVAATLMLRAAAFADPEQREAAQHELRCAVAGWQALSVEAAAKQAWGLGAKAAQQAKAARRAPQQGIKVECPSDEEAETPLALLTEEAAAGESLHTGTRSASSVKTPSPKKITALFQI